MTRGPEPQGRLRVAVLGGTDGAAAVIAAELARSPRVAQALTLGEPAELARERPGAFVYLAASRGRHGGQPDLDDAAACFEAGAGSEHAVVVASAAAYEPSHHHPGLAGEELPPRVAGNPVPVRWRSLEELAGRTLEGEGRTLTVLRPAAMPVPGGRDYWSRLLTGSVAVTLPGFDPTIQVMSLDDVARAVAAAVEGRKAGAFNVAPAAAIPLRQALRRAGSRRLPVPRLLQALPRRLLAALGAASPAEHLDYARYPWTVSGRGIREGLGFVPRDTSAQAIARALGGDAAEAAGDDYDDWGLDPRYIRTLWRFWWRFFHDLYWRIEVRGLEALPAEGRAVLVGVHRGLMPFDGVMALYAIHRATGRFPRFLIHPTLVKFPHLFNLMTKFGGIHACQDNADRVLGRDGLLGIFPEGIRGAFTLYRNAYRLGRFGRDEYVRMALRNRAPLYPFVTVGSAEIFPIFARLRWGWWQRFTEWPAFPITPTFPLLPVPLPSKWHTLFLEPLHVERRYPPEAAEDQETVRAISAQVRERMQDAIAGMLRRRKSVFYGSVFEEELREEVA